jgi:hypothetical protein
MSFTSSHASCINTCGKDRQALLYIPILKAQTDENKIKNKKMKG